MAFEAELFHGDPRMIDYTPGSAVAAGAVVVLNDVPCIAHLDIAANTLGALAIGDGVYKVPKATGGATAITQGKLVYWDDTANVATVTASGNKQLGYTTAAAADADAFVYVYHQPA